VKTQCGTVGKAVLWMSGHKERVRCDREAKCEGSTRHSRQGRDVGDRTQRKGCGVTGRRCVRAQRDTVGKAVMWVNEHRGKGAV
jgi:hypothetical protein